jgi:hypothetical protein
MESMMSAGVADSDAASITLHAVMFHVKWATSAHLIQYVPAIIHLGEDTVGAVVILNNIAQLLNLLVVDLRVELTGISLTLVALVDQLGFVPVRAFTGFFVVNILGLAKDTELTAAYTSDMVASLIPMDHHGALRAPIPSLLLSHVFFELRVLLFFLAGFFLMSNLFAL